MKFLLDVKFLYVLFWFPKVTDESSGLPSPVASKQRPVASSSAASSSQQPCLIGMLLNSSDFNEEQVSLLRESEQAEPTNSASATQMSRFRQAHAQKPKRGRGRQADPDAARARQEDRAAAKAAAKEDRAAAKAAAKEASSRGRVRGRGRGQKGRAKGATEVLGAAPRGPVGGVLLLKPGADALRQREYFKKLVARNGGKMPLIAKAKPKPTPKKRPAADVAEDGDEGGEEEEEEEAAEEAEDEEEPPAVEAEDEEEPPPVEAADGDEHGEDAEGGGEKDDDDEDAPISALLGLSSSEASKVEYVLKKESCISHFRNFNISKCLFVLFVVYHFYMC